MKGLVWKHFDGSEMFTGENLLFTTSRTPMSHSSRCAKPPNKEQQRTQHFQRKGKSTSQLLPDRGFTLVSASCCFFFLPSLLLSFLSPTQSFPDGCVVGWCKLTFPLQPLRHDFFFSRVRAHSPSIRWSGCEQVKLAAHHFQRSINFSGKSKPLWAAFIQKSKPDSLWLLASDHLISVVRVQGEEEGGMKTNEGKPHLKWSWEARKGSLHVPLHQSQTLTRRTVNYGPHQEDTHLGSPYHFTSQQEEGRFSSLPSSSANKKPSPPWTLAFL